MRFPEHGGERFLELAGRRGFGAHAALFEDDKHPNDAGYRVIARAFFDAITKPLSTSSSGRAPSTFFEPPAGP